MATPARTPPSSRPRCAPRPARSGGPRRNATRRDRDVRPAPTGADPRAVPGRRTARRASPRSAPAGRPPRRRGRRARRAGGWSGPGSAGTRPAAAARAGAARARRSTGTRSPRRRTRGAPTPAPARDRRGRRAGAVRSRGPLRRLGARRRSGWRPAGRRASRPHGSTRRRPSGPISTSARCGKPPGCRTPNARHAAPLGSKSESCSISIPSFSLNACWEGAASQETP